MEPINEYVGAIRARLATGVAQEHAHRDALQALLKRLRPDVTPVNEPSRVACGAPDIAVTRTGVVIGYVECKDIDADLKKAEKSDQLKRYREALPNLILTDYLQFRWYVEGKLRQEVYLGHLADERTITTTHEGAESVLGLLREFLQHATPQVGTAKELAERMAGLARMIRHATLEVLKAEGGTGGPRVSAVDGGTRGSRVGGVEDNGATATHGRAARATIHARAARTTTSGPLHAQLEAFREVLIPGLSEDDFADMYAQTIAYGLFAARCNHRGLQPFTRQAAAWDLPKTNPFLQKLFNEIAGPSLDARIAWIVDDLARLLAVASMDSVMQDFTSRTGREDPVVHFYETFLREYDPKLREVRGVYYTPEPVVSYIVRSVDHVLKTEFDMPDGLADERVFILDPACGTGTFLFFAIRHIHDFVVSKYGKGAWPGYVRDKLLKRLFGFELLMAPYTIAHMKLAMELQELGYDFPDDQRLGVYLTNTLEEAAQRSDVLFAQYIADEANAASRVKRDEPIMVVIGNPPYSGHSANRSEWVEHIAPGSYYTIRTRKGERRRTAGPKGARVRRTTFIGRLLRDYYEVDDRPLAERNPKWLQDDYVKFIRFGQWRIERTGHGVLALITNHGYLDNPTFRGMRQQLASAFGTVRVVDLHGNTKKRERTPDGGPDGNVFDIQQGVAIGVFSKRASEARARVVSHGALWGSREAKATWLGSHDLSTTEWSEVHLAPPFYLYAPQDSARLPEFGAGWAVPSAFPVHSMGMNTHRDGLLIDTERATLLAKMRAFRDASLEQLPTVRHGMATDRAVHCQQVLAGYGSTWEERAVRCLYRPFDVRHLYWCLDMIDRPREAVNRHMMGPNIALVTTRQTREPFAALATNLICGQHKITATYDGSLFFPLYLYGPARTSGAAPARRPNLNAEFIAELEARLGLRFVPEGRGDLGLESGTGGSPVSGVGDGTGGSPVSEVEDNSPTAAHARAAHATSTAAHGRAAHATGWEWADWRAEIRVRQGACLPHWTREGGTYAVTFRLHDSLPQQVLDEWRAERDEIIRQAAESDRALSPALEQRLAELQSERIEAYLDAGHGACYLRDPRVAEMVQEALLHFDGERYELLAWCLMPNHVHLVLRPLPGHELDEIMESRKSYTAHEANRLLGRTGSLWQTEYYDHLVRDEGELEHAIGYVLSNPLKAGLEEWPWCGTGGPAVSGVDSGTPGSGVSGMDSGTPGSGVSGMDSGTPGSGVSGMEGNASTATHGRAARATEAHGRAARATEAHGRAARATMHGTFGPEDVLDYIYAVLHSPTYRKRYAEFLKIDFPRIPLTSDVGLFQRLCALGRELVALHLMEHPVLDESPAKLEPAGSNEVGTVRYDQEAQRVYINKQQYFAPVEPEVYAFQVGGYQVLNKWLKDRKGRTLTFEDVRHYGKVVVALRETRRLMAEIDEAIPGWPIE